MVEKNGIISHSAFFESPSLEEKLLDIEQMFPDKVHLSFAWEKNNYTEKVIKRANEVAKETDVLVVIGYSFPFHNRIIDAGLINHMSKKPLKIIIVDKHEEVAKNLPLKFELSETTTIHHINNCSEFYLPHEL